MHIDRTVGAEGPGLRELCSFHNFENKVLY